MSDRRERSPLRLLSRSKPNLHGMKKPKNHTEAKENQMKAPNTPARGVKKAKIKVKLEQERHTPKTTNRSSSSLATMTVFLMSPMKLLLVTRLGVGLEELEK